jgi:hypothetical protein
LFRKKIADDKDNTRARKTLSPASQDAGEAKPGPREPSRVISSVSNGHTNSISRQLTTASTPPVTQGNTWNPGQQIDFSVSGSESSRQDPLGLQVVYQPAGERRFDLVFVHGLGGSSRTTWSHDRDPDFFWPLKFLPFEPDINEARILTFGYNANFRPGSGKNKMSILDFAKDLLYDLKFSQGESVSELENLRIGEVRHGPVLGRWMLIVC